MSCPISTSAVICNPTADSRVLARGSRGGGEGGARQRHGICRRHEPWLQGCLPAFHPCQSRLGHHLRLACCAPQSPNQNLGGALEECGASRSRSCCWRPCCQPREVGRRQAPCRHLPPPPGAADAPAAAALQTSCLAWPKPGFQRPPAHSPGKWAPHKTPVPAPRWPGLNSADSSPRHCRTHPSTHCRRRPCVHGDLRMRSLHMPPAGLHVCRQQSAGRAVGRADPPVHFGAAVVDAGASPSTAVLLLVQQCLMPTCPPPLPSQLSHDNALNANAFNLSSILYAAIKQRNGCPVPLTW